jgi:hypothetical protein
MDSDTLERVNVFGKLKSVYLDVEKGNKNSIFKRKLHLSLCRILLLNLYLWA